jgi:hypothetical protein
MTFPHLNPDREARRQQLEDAQPKTTDAEAMIEMLGKQMLDMTPDEIEQTFGRRMRIAFDRGYQQGNSCVIYAERGIMRRACQSGVSQRVRHRRLQRKIDGLRESEGAPI